MPSDGVRGRVVTSANAPLADFVVGAFDVAGLAVETLLPDTGSTDEVFPGFVRTSPNGEFDISYVHHATDWQLRVVVFDQVMRRIGVSNDVANPPDGKLGLPSPITVDPADASGWLVNHGEFRSQFTGTSIDLLVDNHRAWKEILNAIDSATSSINFMLFFLDLREITFLAFNPDPPVPGSGPTQGVKLEQRLLAAARRGVKVRLCCNNDMPDFLDSIAGVSSAHEVEDYFSAQADPNLEVRRFETPIFTPNHAKLLVIDDTVGFSIGSPFIQDYYDDHTHLYADPRHRTFRCTSASQIRVPTHDVSAKIKGPAVQALNETFRLHWNFLTPAAPSRTDLSPAPIPEATGTTTVQVARTVIGNGRFSTLPHGETGILESYLRAIRNAQHFIYLENQYFTSEQIADALICSLKLNRNLQVILLTNNKVDIPGYATWHPQNIQRVLRGLSEDERDRFGVFTLWSHEQPLPGDGPTIVCRNYVHSKVAIVDDSWATLGSANLDGVSLMTSQNATRKTPLIGPFGITIAVNTPGLVTGFGTGGNVLENRELDANLIIYNGVQGLPVSTAPGDLRRLLWAEHLAFRDSSGEPDPTDPALASPPANGWLHLWREKASEKLEGMSPLGESPITVTPQRILPYPYEVGDPQKQLDNPGRYPYVDPAWHDATAYLRASGVDTSHLEVHETFRRFSFVRGDWDEPLPERSWPDDDW